MKDYYVIRLFAISIAVNLIIAFFFDYYYGEKFYVILIVSAILTSLLQMNKRKNKIINE